MSYQAFHSVIEVAGRKIGRGQPCLVVAEIGINHNGNMDLAKREIDAAAKAGADVVKFQNYRVEDFLSDRRLMFTYKSQGRQVTEPQYDMFRRYELTLEQLNELKQHCNACHLLFQSTPMSVQGVKDLIAIGAPILKNGSDALSHLELVKAMGNSGLPTVVSTGMATAAEIDEAVQTYRQTGNRSMVLLHCVSSYPAPAAETNLARLRTLADVFGCPVGFSDHTQGYLAAALSITFGACLIEKHFTLDHDLAGPDHWFSVTPRELADLVKAVRDAGAMVGSPHARADPERGIGAT
jgi:N-acetylneuraminate synthase/N,N'-diacetyllegionaminate synthase